MSRPVGVVAEQYDWLHLFIMETDNDMPLQKLRYTDYD